MTADPDRSWGRRGAWGFALALAGVALWRWFAAGSPPGGDWAQYLGHAWALVQGRPYDDTGYLYTDLAWTVGPLRYPPGLPLTLAPLLAWLGPASEAPRLLMHAFLAGFLAASAAWLAREDEPLLAAAATGMAGLSLLIQDVPQVVGSDLGFCALAWGVILLADRPGAWSTGRILALATLGAGALLYRIAAAPLLPALVWVAMARRREIGLRATLPLLLWTAALLVVLTRFGPGGAPADTMAAGSSGGGGRDLLATLEWVVRRLDSKLLRYRFAAFETWLYPFPVPLLNHAWHVAAIPLTALGLAPWLWRRRASFGAAFLLGTLAMLAVLPVWQSRYLWVLAPFLAWGLVRGLRDLLGRVGTPAPHTAGARAALVVAVLMVGALVQTVREPRPRIDREEATFAAVRDTLRALPAEPPVRLASNRPRKVAWYTGLPAMPIFDRELDVFVAEATRQHLTHAVITEAGTEPELLARWDAWMRERPELFRPLGTVGPVRIYALELPLNVPATP
ncbi:MAG: hypothetical protein R3E98_08600 [Gemmatimonadota bacterium]